MLRAQSGDESAYRVLLTDLGRVSSAYLRGRFGDQGFVEDCVQDTLLAIHQARATYDPRRPFRAWFYAILRHKAVDHLRRQRTQQLNQQLDQQLDRHRQLDRHERQPDTPDMHHQQQALDEAIAPGRLLSALSRPHREAITLTKIIGLSYAEAAARLDISEGALKVRVHRAIGRLRRILEAEG